VTARRAQGGPWFVHCSEERQAYDVGGAPPGQPPGARLSDRRRGPHELPALAALVYPGPVASRLARSPQPSPAFARSAPAHRPTRPAPRDARPARHARPPRDAASRDVGHAGAVALLALCVPGTILPSFGALARPIRRILVAPVPPVHLPARNSPLKPQPRPVGSAAAHPLGATSRPHRPCRGESQLGHSNARGHDAQTLTASAGRPVR
jgi:hypothetical protein